MPRASCRIQKTFSLPAERPALFQVICHWEKKLSFLSAISQTHSVLTSLSISFVCWNSWRHWICSPAVPPLGCVITTSYV